MFARSAFRAAQPLKMVCPRNTRVNDALCVYLDMVSTSPPNCRCRQADCYSLCSMRVAMPPSLAQRAAPTLCSTAPVRPASSARAITS